MKHARPIKLSEREVRGILDGSVRAVARPIAPGETIPGDGAVLYVREGWSKVETADGPSWAYRATHTDSAKSDWRPNSNMPKAAARIFLTVTGTAKVTADGSGVDTALAGALGILRKPNPATGESGFLPPGWPAVCTRDTHAAAFTAMMEEQMPRNAHGQILVILFSPVSH